MSPIQLLLVLSVTGVSLYGCVGPVKHEMTTDYPAAVLYAVGTPPVIEGRAAFGKFFASFWLQNLNTRGLMARAKIFCCGSMTNPCRVRYPIRRRT
jgi:hypothetical protein